MHLSAWKSNRYKRRIPDYKGILIHSIRIISIRIIFRN